jgi:hypothetical protein
MKCLLLALALMLASCDAHVDLVQRGDIKGSHAFAFGNLVSLTVEAESATYEQREISKLHGLALRAPYTELTVKLANGDVLATDREQGNNALSIGGHVYNGTAFVLHADGSVSAVASGGGGQDRAR